MLCQILNSAQQISPAHPARREEISQGRALLTTYLAPAWDGGAGVME